MKNYKIGDKVVIEFEVVDTSNEWVNVQKDSYHYALQEFSIKHAEPEFEPREMMVWDNDGITAIKREVIGICDGQYLTKQSCGKIVGFLNASEIPKELENGKVYKSTSNDIVFKINDKESFGFNNNGVFKNNNCHFEYPECWQEYPLEEFKKLLIAETEKRGFKSGVWVDRKDMIHVSPQYRILQLKNNEIRFSIYKNKFLLFMEDTIIFSNGIWAKIIE